MLLEFTYSYPTYEVQHENELGAWLAVIGVASPVIFWSAHFMYKRRYSRLWERGVFPKRLSFKRKHLLEAYICLAARMIQSDTENAGEKLKYMSNYFQRYFPKENYDFAESISYSYRHPIKVSTVSRWLNLHLKGRDQRMQIMYFLAGLAMVDGRLLKSEVNLLRKLNDLLLLSPKDFDSIIAMYQQRQERQREQQRSKPASISTKKRLIQLSCQVLGVSEHASMDEIKKAYRSLVKLHHPDRFVNDSVEQQNIAEARFIEIQKAYEYLEKWK